MTEKKEMKIKPLCFNKNSFPLRSFHTFKYNNNTSKVTSEVNKQSFTPGYLKFAGYPDRLNIELDYPSCFAIRIAKLLLDIIRAGKFKVGKGCSFQDDFYKASSAKINSSELILEIIDNELMIIYIKQTVHLLRKCGIIRSIDGTASVNWLEISDQKLYISLFCTFWYKVSWKEIFPSDPDAAEDLWENRSFIRDLLIRNSNSIELDTFAKEFFSMTGFAEPDDIVQISFIDFYLITWLRHFGIINYIDISRNTPVYIELTDFGRKLLFFTI